MALAPDHFLSTAGIAACWKSQRVNASPPVFTVLEDKAIGQSGEGGIHPNIGT